MNVLTFSPDIMIGIRGWFGVFLLIYKFTSIVYRFFNEREMRKNE